MVRFWQISFGIAAVGFALVFLFIAAGVDYAFIEEDDGTEEAKSDRNSGKLFLFVCSPLFLIPTIVFLLIGILGLVKRRKNRELAEVLKANRRIKVEDFAKKVGKSEMEAEKTIMRILEDKQIEGYMDRRTGEFFTKDFLDQTPDVRFGWKCPSCGAKNDSVILPGEMGKCKFCDSPVAPIGGGSGSNVSSKPTQQQAPRSPPQSVPISSPVTQPPPNPGWNCPACGAHNQSIILPGQTGSCKFCNSVITPADSPVPPQGWNCPACGSPNQSIIRPGETGTCTSCNSTVTPASGGI